MDRYLRVTYKLYLRWAKRGLADSKTRQLAAARNIRLNKRRHPIGVLLVATSPVTDPKIISRWTRALELALFREIEPDRLGSFIREHGGLSGCARQMAKFEPKRRLRRGSYNNPTPVPQETHEDIDPVDTKISSLARYKTLNGLGASQLRTGFKRPMRRKFYEVEDLSWDTKPSKRRISSW
jgi:hypothetical protein